MGLAKHGSDFHKGKNSYLEKIIYLKNLFIFIQIQKNIKWKIKWKF